MAAKLTIGSIIEKNKIDSDKFFVILIDAHIKDSEGNAVTTISFAQNSENIVFNGTTYQAANFEIDISVENNSEPSIRLTAQDQTRTLQQYIEAYDGLVDNEVVMTIVNTGALDQPAELSESFKVLSTSNNEYVVEMQLGTDSAVNKRFPQYRQFKDRCSWAYKGPRCKYAGPLGSCSFTLFGSNGCVAHNNVINFGGYPGLNTLQ